MGLLWMCRTEDPKSPWESLSTETTQDESHGTDTHTVLHSLLGLGTGLSPHVKFGHNLFQHRVGVSVTGRESPASIQGQCWSGGRFPDQTGLY